MEIKQKTTKELRKFGLVMTVPLALIGGYLWWKDNQTFLYLFSAAGFFLSTGLLVPQVLRPVEKAWMWFAEILGAIMTRVILTLAFLLVMLPMGLLLKLIGKDLLDLKMDPGRTSYWVPVEEDGPATRPGKPY